MNASLNDPKRAYPGRGRNACFDRSAHRIDISIDNSADLKVDGNAVHSSKTIVIVESNLFWDSMQLAGVKRWRLPSI